MSWATQVQIVAPVKRTIHVPSVGSHCAQPYALPVAAAHAAAEAASGWQWAPLTLQLPAHEKYRSLSWRPLLSSFFSHISLVLQSVIVPFPLSAKPVVQGVGVLVGVGVGVWVRAAVFVGVLAAVAVRVGVLEVVVGVFVEGDGVVVLVKVGGDSRVFVGVGTTVCVGEVVGAGGVAHPALSSAPMIPSPLVSAASMQVVKLGQAVFPEPPQRALGSTLQLTLPAAVFLMHGTTPLLAGTPQTEAA